VGTLPLRGLPVQCGLGGTIMKRLATRSAVIPVLCAATLPLLAQPASSAPPRGEVTILSPGPGPNDTATPVCDFPVRIDITHAQAVRHTFPDGSVVITGPAVAEVTNLTSGESATYNISGPGVLAPDNRLTARGTNIILGPEGQTGDEDNFLVITSGTLGFVLGEPIDDPLRGTIRHDVCAELG
jgi:hypothetical protein